MKNTMTKVWTLRAIAFFMLIMGIIGMVKDTNYATVCLCGASSLVIASNRLLRGNR
ncbi:hypothetical protein [uncultured Ruminococcus sp.]|uniref:hypothetical protein n=1 Tax=uncultured Ruminococcus sp. TaxID=165186 RepID=UPI0025D91962|nr:hypothetical protein [uncultured Ruminococcus sp.]